MIRAGLVTAWCMGLMIAGSEGPDWGNFIGLMLFALATVGLLWTEGGK